VKEHATTGAANKNAKRREARKRAAAEGNTAEGTTDSDAIKSADGTSKKVEEAPEEVDPEVEKEKEAKKLMKKLRQARELKDKKEKGDTLLPEQLEKVIKINELIRLLDNIGFDVEGVKKGAA
jgi:partner of Y14 and mago protein